MLIPAAERRIWLCVAPTDMRRSFDRLAALARNHLREGPADGSWFVYVNRSRTIVKVLSFDGGGYWSEMLMGAGGSHNIASRDNSHTRV